MARLLARCPRCGDAVLLTYGEASYRNLAIFEAMPWSPFDEAIPEDLTDAARKRYLAQLPYRLYICYIDLARGTWQVAMARSNEKLRQGVPLWKPHNCLAEEGDGSLDSRRENTLPDHPAVAIDEGKREGHLDGGGIRRRSPRVVRARTGGV